MNQLCCPCCGKKNSEFDLSCISCGEPLPSDSVQTRIRSDSATASFNDWPSKRERDPLHHGEEIAHFEIMAKVGQGGMGTVYKARDCRLDRFVALKVFHPLNLAADQGYEYLLKEAKLASSLNHPNIVTIHDIGRSETLDFMAMEWLDGKTLNLLIPENGMSLAIAMDYARQIADGLTHAHKHGIIHRDIKPQNLLVTRLGELKILDFGVARLQKGPDWREMPSQPDLVETARGVLKGTMPYMSPEQTRGDPIDKRSDIFSFGVVFYQMLTGERPFQDNDFKALAERIIHATPHPISYFRDDIPAAIESLVLRCLEKKPEKRFGSMDEVIAKLFRRESDIIQLKAQAPFIAERTPLWPRLKKVWVGLAALAFVIISGLVWRTSRSEPVLAEQPPAAPTQRIAVRPFGNISGDPMGKVFCDGLTATLTTQLARLENYRQGVWVTPGFEIRRLTEASVRQIRDEFGVELLISGHVQDLGKSRRLTLILIQTDTEIQIGTRVVEIEEDALFSLQDRVFDLVLDLLGWELEPEIRDRIGNSQTSLAGAYRHYLHGQGYLYRYDQDQSVKNAIVAMESALAVDPGYAPAHVGLSEAYWLNWRANRDPNYLKLALDSARSALALNAYDPSVQIVLGHIYTEKGEYEQARIAFEKALDLEPENAKAHYGLARVYEDTGQRERAERVFLRALEIHPNDWSGHNKLGTFYFHQGMFAKAAKTFRRQIDLTPNNPLCHNNLAMALHARGEDVEALTHLDKALALSPRSKFHSNKGVILFYQNRYKEAVQSFQQAVLKEENHHAVWGNLADAYRWAPGLKEEAEPAYNRAIQLVRAQLAVNPNNRELRAFLALYLAKIERFTEAVGEFEKIENPDLPHLLYHAALIYELGGHREKAIGYVEAALARGYPLADIRSDPELNALRKDPGFAALLNRVTLQ